MPGRRGAPRLLPVHCGEEPLQGHLHHLVSVRSSDLVGQPYIRTLNNDKDAADFGFLRFEVDRPVTVIVAHDARFPSPPSWLQFWRIRDDGLTVTDPNGPERVLYERDFPAGEIALGANRDPGMPEDLSMYSVIVVSRGAVPARANEWVRYE